MTTRNEETTTGEAIAENRPQDNNRTINQRWNNNRTSTSFYSSDRDFVGTSPKIGGIICLPAETHIVAKVSYTRFKELMAVYVVKNYRDTVEIAVAIRNGNDPLAEFDVNFKPDPYLKVQAGTVDELILRETVKDYLQRRRNIESNLTKMFSLIWGQCTKVYKP